MSLTSRAMRMAHRTLDLAMGGKAAGSGGRASGGKIGGGGKTGGKQHAAAAGISAGPIPSAGGSASRGGRRERHSGVRVSALSSTTFPCGYFFYEYRHKQPLDPKQVVAVHHNWCEPRARQHETSSLHIRSSLARALLPIVPCMHANPHAS